MGRYYHLSKKINEERAKVITAELKEMQDVKAAEITADQQFLIIETLDDQFTEVMGNVVNIFSREADGTELSFARFAM